MLPILRFIPLNLPVDYFLLYIHILWYNKNKKTNANKKQKNYADNTNLSSLVFE